MRPPTPETATHMRISSGAVESAERALRGIPVSGAKAEISAALEIIQGIEIVSPSIPSVMSPVASLRNFFPDCSR